MRSKILSLAVVLFLLATIVPMAVQSRTEGVKDLSTSGIPVSAPGRSGPNVSGGLYDGFIRYDDVALLVNNNSPVSREIGTYFAAKRGLSKENIINLTVPAREQINPTEFDNLAQQVKDALSSRGLTDRINYLVTTKGMPLGVWANNWRAASVDSELMLLDSDREGSIHNQGWIDNPYFESYRPFSREEYGIRLVTRLDGYTVDEIKGMIDRAGSSLGNRGKALLDTDPGKGYQPSGYGMGNYWMENAHQWLVDHGHESHLDRNNTFITGWNDTMAYFSWGSNDGDWYRDQMANGGFEYGTGSTPNNWFDIIGERTTEDKSDGTYSFKVRWNSTIMSGGGAKQWVDLNYPDHRYFIDAKVKLANVGYWGARVYIKVYDNLGQRIWFQEIFNGTGTRDWQGTQRMIEALFDSSLLPPNAGTPSKMLIAVQLSDQGTAYFDGLDLRVVRPRNSWVNGSIAETCVSTGGRSMNYGTTYGQSLVADLVRDGVTGVKGYVYEPFLDAIAHADILFPAYYSSYNLAESYWMASEFGSWMDTVLGDPKCTPFLNERADMGFAPEGEPIWTDVDGDGIPFVYFSLHNKGRKDVTNGLVEVYEDGVVIKSISLNIPFGGYNNVSLSSKDFPIIGDHEFKVVLNSDGFIWEFDQSNNEAVKVLHVNHIPTMAMQLEDQELQRTHPLDFSIELMDEDGDLNTSLLDLHVEGPRDETYLPEVLSSNGNGTSLLLNVRFVPPWNSSLGYHSVVARYQDVQGSFAEVELRGVIRVQNTYPVLEGNVSTAELMRGGDVDVTLNWSDPDTPDGSLEVEVYTEDSFGHRLDPFANNITSNWSGISTFRLPADERARLWEFHAKVTDRNGATDVWTGSLRTLNAPPEVEVVSGLGQNITKVQMATIYLRYLDPEGMPSSSFTVTLYGPEGMPNAAEVLKREATMGSGDIFQFEIAGSVLSPGSYDLAVSYADDERIGGRREYRGALRIVNMEPLIGAVSIGYPDGEGLPGGSVQRGTSFTVAVSIRDPDSSGWDLELQANLGSPSGVKWRDLYLDHKGSGIYSAKLSTDATWPVGAYSLKIIVRDPDGGESNLSLGRLVVIDAPFPLFDEASVKVFLNGSAAVEATIIFVIGSSLPIAVDAYLLDQNGTPVGQGPMSGRPGSGIWEAYMNVSGPPVSISLHVMDDLGRQFWLNGTPEVDVEEPPIDGGEEPEEGGTDQTLLITILAAALIIILLVLVLLVVIALRRQGQTRYLAAPPTVHPLGASDTQSLPGKEKDSLPPASSDQTSQNPLLPPKELKDGSLYHRPDRPVDKQKAPVKKPSAKREEEEEEMRIMPPMPVPPPPQPPEMPSSPVALEGQQPPAEEPVLTEALNNENGVVPPIPDVQDTHDNDLGGDTSQGVPPDQQGPGD